MHSKPSTTSHNIQPVSVYYTKILAVYLSVNDLLTAIMIALALFVYEVQKQAFTGLPKRRLYADLHWSTNGSGKPLHLRYRLDTAADVNIMPLTVYKICLMTTAWVSVNKYKLI